jgi:large subunit ribosomal protein L17
MAISLIEHKRIRTTVAKAKALRVFVEPVVNRSKNDTTHSRRMVFRALQSKEAVNILFREVAKKVTDRPGGYTRILKTDNRLGDNAEMCYIELVDYNEDYFTDKPGSGKKKRTRRGSSTTSKSSQQTEKETVDTKEEETPKNEAPANENTEADTEENNKSE